MTGRHPRPAAAALLGLVISCALLATVIPAPPAASEDHLVAAVVGDYGVPGPNSAAVAALIAGWSPALVLTTGDNSYTGDLDADVGALYHDFIHPYVGRHGAGAATNRFFPGLGNHDWDLVFDCSGDSCRGAYRDFFALPGNERYYDFTAGPVHFFVLDSDHREPHGTASTSRQATWLKAALEGSGARWKIVTFHHPPFGSGPADPALRWPFRDWGATAVISGHHHVYERVMKDDFPYFVNGLGGRSRHPFATIEPGSAVRFNAEFGAMRIEASADSLTLRFFAVNAAEPIDSWTAGSPALAPATWGAIKAAYR